MKPKTFYWIQYTILISFIPLVFFIMNVLEPNVIGFLLIIFGPLFYCLFQEINDEDDDEYEYLSGE